MITQNLKEMNVNNKILKIFVFILLCGFYYSCKCDNNKEEENTYQVLNLLTNEFTANSKKIILTLPPPPNGTKLKYKFSIKDSLSLYKQFYEEALKQKVIALQPKMFGIDKQYSFKKDCNVNPKLLQSFSNLKDSKNIDLNKIVLYKNNSVIYYTDNHRKMYDKGFGEIDICLNFSRIIFSKDYKDAILILGISYGKLNGFSTLYRLEKTNQKWHIKCEKGLTIS
jgi:hypothetical protein